MKKIIFLICACWVVMLMVSCDNYKTCAPCGYLGYVAEPRYENLLTTSYGLISTNSIDSLSTGLLHHYIGTVNDSLFFLFHLFGFPNAIHSCIGNITVQSVIDTAIYEDAISSTDTAALAYDTLVTAYPWRPGYSDTLLISKNSPTTFVFQVRYQDSVGSGVELDSFIVKSSHQAIFD